MIVDDELIGMYIMYSICIVKQLDLDDKET